jgi:hypothetical protein
MSSLKKMADLANKFEHKLAQVQHTQSAQPSELEKALRAAGVRPEAEHIAPFLDKARVPTDASVNVQLKVNPNQSVSFVTTPVFAALNGLLNQAYSNKMQAALKAANLAPAEPMVLNLATF